MFNFTIISKKGFLSFLNKANLILVNFLNNLKLSNLKRLTKLFFVDKRVIITLIIIFFSVFIHLCTPAFYKDSWVKEKIKNRFEKEFNFEIIFSDKLSYSIFPTPHFSFEDVKFISQDKNLATIGSIKVYLTFKKFFDKNKMNIQETVIDKAKFNLYKNDVTNFLSFFNKKINDKEIIITDSQIFFKNEKDDIFSIISLKKNKSFFDNIEFINKLNLDGEIFNIPFQLQFINNFFDKKADVELKLDKLNKKFKNVIDFKKEVKVGLLSYFDSRKKHETNYKIHKDNLEFYSDVKVDNKFLYKGNVEFSPFTSNIDINLKNINLSNFLNNQSLFIDLLKSNIFANKNLNFYIKINSKNVSDHRKLKNLELNINYENEILNFNQSNLLLEDILLVRLLNSEFKSHKNKLYFFGEFDFKIEDYLNLYKFFQTKKESRKKIDTINLVVKYDFLKNKLDIVRINIDGQSNDSLQNILEEFNQEKRTLSKRIDLRNLFNSIAEAL